MDSLGDRMKEYENVTRNFLTRRTPVIIRLDGKAFHTFTRKFDRPYDIGLIQAMNNAARATIQEIQNGKVYYHQSDEVSILIMDYDKLETESWFGNNIQKMVSVASSVMTANFNKEIGKYGKEIGKEFPLAFFDARVFNIPEAEVVNYFLWRAKDWERNSLQMYCSKFFSHKELEGKNRQAKHDMLHSIGKNWATDLEPIIKNGTFYFNSNAGYPENSKDLYYHLEPEWNNLNSIFKELEIL